MNNLKVRRFVFKYYCCLIALGTLDDMLLPLVGDINHSLADTARHHRYAALHSLLIRWRQLIRAN